MTIKSRIFTLGAIVFTKKFPYFRYTQINYLSSLFLTLELLPSILEAASSSGDARIIFVSSNSHRFVSWDPENFSPVEEGYNRLKTYALTKMYNVRLV
jgi:NAD(P)-dependent dehydrogenase (short-subunit alcohol dehydrogenase family)